MQTLAKPALGGLQYKLGVPVSQISLLPVVLYARIPELLQRLALMLYALLSLTAQVPDVIVVVEVRDAIWLNSEVVYH